jgi:hypothetical protein
LELLFEIVTVYLMLSPCFEYPLSASLFTSSAGWKRFTLCSSEAGRTFGKPVGEQATSALFGNGSAAPAGMVNVGVETSSVPEARVTFLLNPMAASVILQTRSGVSAELVFLSVRV